MRVVSLCLFVCLSFVPVQTFAVPVAFDFSSSSSRNSYFDLLTYDRAGLQLEIFSSLAGAQVSQTSSGLGVRAVDDSSATLDGGSSFDSLTFSFFSLVTLVDVLFSYVESADEFSLQAGLFDDSYTIPEGGLVTNLSISANEFIFGVTDANDDYRIESMIVDFDDQAPVPTPEPSTWLLLGSGLAGLVCWQRKRSG